MFSNSVIEKFKNTKFFNRLFPNNDDVMFMFIYGDELMKASNLIDPNFCYTFFVVTKKTLIVRQDEMIVYGANKIKWIFVPYSIFTDKKLYFRLKFSTSEFNDLFLYSIKFINDDHLIYLNDEYKENWNQLKLFGSNITLIKNYINMFYQKHAEFIESINLEDISGFIQLGINFYHTLFMSYILNNEEITEDIVKKIKKLTILVRNNPLQIDDELKQFAINRFNLFKSLCTK